jgi:hypothetical protein
MATTLALGCWSLGARAQKLPDYHKQCQVGSSSGAATTVHRRLTLTVVAIIRWFKDLDVIFIIFRVLCIYCEPL